MRLKIGISILVILILNCGCRSSRPEPATAQSKPSELNEGEVFEKLVKSQVEVGDTSLVGIVDRKPWPSAPFPDATVILGTARHPQQDPAKSGDYDYFSFVLLAQGDARAKQPSLISLGLVVPDLPLHADRDNRPLSVDVAPMKIREDEYVFGTRHLVGNLGNKGGRLYEVMNLYRFHDASLKEIFRDVVWVEGNKSCNVEMKIVQQPSQTEGFFDIAREFSRSYLGDAKNPQFSNSPAQPEVSADCSLTHELRKPNIQKWDPALGEYVDANGRFLHGDDLFKGWPFP
jgi:hypothetical protein